jgi:hypothetical protein
MSLALADLTAEDSGEVYFQGHNARRNARAAQHQLQFIGVDGEGISYPDPSGATYEAPVLVDFAPGIIIEETVTRPVMLHKYVLLSVGDKSFHRDGEEITFDDVLSFLWECFLENPAAVFVGYFLSYDFTQWFKNLTESTAHLLLSDEGAKSRVRKVGKNPKPIPVRYKDWWIDIHAGKRFRMRHRDAPGKWLYVNDAGPFFQSSFLAAIDPARWPIPICSDEEFEIILAGKRRRNDAEFDTEMILYNQTENIVLGRVMEQLNSGFVSMGVKLNKDQWYGPGQAAQKWLHMIKAPQRRDLVDWVPERVLQLGLESYYGGWFEIPAHGFIFGESFEYDRNSAYPYEIARLPCLQCGQWQQVRNPPDANGEILCLVDATVRQRKNSSARLGSMPYRTKQGLILRPRNTRGVYWWHEIQAVKDAGCIDAIEIHEAWIYETPCNHKPFAAIAKLYEQRQSVGKNTPMGLALKLVYNSAYGKLAQSVGDPRFANPIYASLITAGCRTEIWKAISSHPARADAVTMVATDGVFFTSPHPGLQLSDRLGDWSVAYKSNLCQMMPGLYWDDAARESEHGKVRSRGIAAGDLRNVIKFLDMQWRTFNEKQRQGLSGSKTARKMAKVWHDGGQDKKAAKAIAQYLVKDKWPTVTVPIRFGMTSAKLALHRRSWKTAGALNSNSRIISGNPWTKRNPASRYLDDNGICWTEPYTQGSDGIRSTPYDKQFGLELKARLIEDDVLTADGTIDDELYEWVKDSDG